jgi:hypothetical protein
MKLFFDVVTWIQILKAYQPSQQKLIRITRFILHANLLVFLGHGLVRKLGFVFSTKHVSFA